MATVFNWFRPGYELSKFNFDWNVQVPFFQRTDGKGDDLYSNFFTSQEKVKWQLFLFDENPKTLSFCVFHYNSAKQNVTIVEPVLVKISILNGKGLKIFQQTMTSPPNSKYVEFFLIKQEVIASECQQADGSYTFCCKILSHVKKEPVLSTHPPGLVINCSDELITQLEKLFDEMLFSDVLFNISGHEFPAHKSILAARSEVFAAMFQHPTKEKLTNQIIIDDIEPEVFHGLLRFIYTGRLNSKTMEMTAAGLLIAADKYLLVKLKNECGNYLIRQMSPVNCVELLLHGDLLDPEENLKKVMKESAKFFRRLPSEVMATAKWEKMEEENPKKLFQILKFLSRNK